MNACEEFAATVIGEPGVVDVPVGRPKIAIETDPLNPCSPTTETVTGALAPPCTRLTDFDENIDVTDMEKSGVGGGGGGADDEPPPQLNASPRTAVSETILMVEFRMLYSSVSEFVSPDN